MTTPEKRVRQSFSKQAFTSTLGPNLHQSFKVA